MTEVDKQTAILNTTLDLIAEQGFHNTPMSQIAKRSGVSAGIIYHYFENKDDLIHELYRHIKKEFTESMLAAEPQSLPWPLNLRQLWLNIFHFYATHPKETLFLEQYENSPFGKHGKDYEMDENALALKQMMDASLASGLLRPMPEMVLYDLSFGVALSLAKRQISGELTLSQAELEAVADACLRAITN